ncbi:MAG: hypothetical protein GX539_14055 [Candidatus Cloacimonetes bacterium]|nr:hypothetical protein [Candidatus Cloacimonadota bacterium]
MSRSWRMGAVALLAVMSRACVDSGLPGKNLPLDVARFREWSYPLYEAAVTPSGLPDLVSFDDATWALQAATRTEAGLESALERNPQFLRPVSGGEAQFLALTWDQSPYNRLFLRAPSGLRTYERVF